MTHTKHNRRDGAILLIVLVLLALFAVIGLTFVLYSQSEAVNSRIHREAMADPGDKPDDTAAINAFYSQLLYPVPDSGPGITSAMRGHDMARMVYGYNSNTNNIIPPGILAPVRNRAPYSGVGIFRENISTADAGAIDRLNAINFSVLNGASSLIDPENSNSIGARTGTNAFTSSTGPTGQFVPKNAPYTYADRNNAYLAQLDPASGQIVVPSFHRPGLFGSLASTNPNWTSPAGKYTILRPRPADHLFDSGDGRGTVSDFPYPPANPDGTITGDLQNYRWGNGTQQNDSVWLHANLPPVKWRGRMLQPLVAPLIIALDGRVNLGVAGTLNNGTTHSSQNGFGPYEINPGKIAANIVGVPGVNMTADAAEIVKYRNQRTSPPKPISAAGAPAATTANFIQPTPGGNPEVMNDWMPINWDSISPNRIPNPTTVGYAIDPNFPTTGWDNNYTGGTTNHHSLYNPYFEFESNTTGVGGRTLKMLDLRTTGYRYSTKTNVYTPPLYGLQTMSNSFTGSAPNHPSNLIRSLTTPVSNSLNYAGATSLFGPSNISLVPSASPFDPSATTANAPAAFNPAAAPGVDSMPNNGYRSALAALGPVNLNRPLTDYRVDITKPLSDPVNINALSSQPTNAFHDRQIFAMDIFDRLILATGAPCDSIDGQTGRPVITNAANNPASQPVLRYLAQIAVNIVDQIDNDDISTSFVWNPATNSITPWAEQANFGSTPGAGDYVGNHVVFGVEKTRLVLNEVYSEVTNDANDPGLGTQNAQNEFQVRFFIEVLNPLNVTIPRSSLPVTTADAQSPMAGGKADLYVGGHSVYRFQIFNKSTDATTIRTNLFGPTAVSNVTGAVSLPTSPVTPMATALMPQNAQAVPPNENNTTVGDGFCHLFPSGAVGAAAGQEYRIAATSNRRLAVPDTGGPQNRLYYTVPNQFERQIKTSAVDPLNQGGVGSHTVVMQRLANPYLGPSQTNPWITVDAMYDIRTNDAVRIGKIEPRPNPLPPLPGTRITGPLPDANQNKQQAHARRAPMYAFHGVTPQMSFAIDGQRTMANDGAAAGNPIYHNPNLIRPFEWLTHFDRKLINNTELLSVSAVKPHEQLHYFATSANGQTAAALQPADKQKQLAPWLSPQTNLSRALSALDVKPYMYGIPTGGRQPGRMNVNAMWHKDALKAVLDANGGNFFNDGTGGDVDSLWNSVFAGPGTIARSRNFPNVNETIDDNPTAPNPDQPIKSLASGRAIQGSLLRPDPASASPTVPVVMQTASLSGLPHHYLKEEMLRKMANNVGTTSDTYLVLFTIGYFEIRATGSTTANPTRLSGVPTLGREAFAEIPGDLRVQYASTIDRSMIGIDSTIDQDPNAPAPSKFFITELIGSYATDPQMGGGNVVRANYDPAWNVTTAATLLIRCQGGDATGLTVNYEGRSYKICNKQTNALAANEVNTIIVGHGTEARSVSMVGCTFTAPASINSVNGSLVPNAGYGAVTMPLGTFVPISTGGGGRGTLSKRDYPAGSMVSNVYLGNPGPQPALDVNTPGARLIIRDLQKLK